jgi:hypothetical protein
MEVRHHPLVRGNVGVSALLAKLICAGNWVDAGLPVREVVSVFCRLGTGFAARAAQRFANYRMSVKVAWGEGP